MKLRLFGVLAILVLALVVFVMPAVAHESREVGDIIVVFGWRVEPAIAEETNGPEFFTYARNADGTRGDRIEGGEFEYTVTFGDETMSGTLRPAFRDPGHYVADLIPTQPGDYQFQVTGTINGIEVDEVFDSADGEFSGIEPAADMQFPTQTMSMVEMSELIASLEARIAELEAQLAP